MPMYDFKCTNPRCGHVDEEVVPSGTEEYTCTECGAKSKRFFADCAKTLTTIIPDYPGCKKKRAGYVHTHGDKPATRVQGCGFSKSD